MAKIQKVETTHYVYEYELSDEELKLYQENEDEFWEQWDEDNWGDYYMDVDSTPTEINLIEE
jgi:hypothetical protein